jgi:2,3-bisphosphoglycerate-dependent phosphoglycerate mutase
MSHLVIVRHGQSQYNRQDRFTGQLDVALTDLGRKEAMVAGRKIRRKHLSFDFYFTSDLKRAINTMSIILDELKVSQNLRMIVQSPALRERAYGELQGMNKTEVATRYSEKQVHVWRRSFSARPPGGESLEDTYARVVAYYTTSIRPMLKAGRNVLIVAHGNSLRALMMHLEKIGKRKIEDIEIATGIPRMYTFTKRLRLSEVADL